MKKIITSLTILLILNSCKNEPAPTSSSSTNTTTVTSTATPVISYNVKHTYPHDVHLFTEGLLFNDGVLFESTGSPQDLPEAKSMIGISDLTTGKFTPKVTLDGTRYFGEGIVVFKDKLYQLTYKNQEGFIYDLKTFRQTGKFSYVNKEGWSLTTDGTSLIMSDGTSNLTFLNPDNQQPVKTLGITYQGAPQDQLNELEFINGFIYANIWMTNDIVKIDPASGKVVGKLDLSTLAYEAKNKNPNCDVLNGIAYDAKTDRIIVTGKMWPNYYEISFPH